MNNLENRYINPPRFKIPDNHKIIFESNLFRICQWEQELLDGSYANFEAIKRQDNAQILLVKEDKIILIEEQQPHFTKPLIGLPGGNVEWEEEPIKAAKRETLEETGYSTKNLKLFSMDYFTSQKLFRSFYLYIGYVDKKIHESQNTNYEKVKILELNFRDFVTKTQEKDFRNIKLKSIIRELIKKNELAEFKKYLFNKSI